MNMQVKSNISQIGFKAITLNKEEERRTTVLLNSLGENTGKDELIKSQLFDVFDKHIQKEAGLKVKSCHSLPDFLQKIYLAFLEKLEAGKTEKLTSTALVEYLNIIKPAKDEILPDFAFDTKSIHSKISNNMDFTLETLLTEGDLPVYASSANQEERLPYQQHLKNVIETSSLKDKEKEVLLESGSGKTYRELAEEYLTSVCSIREKIFCSLIKLKYSLGLLPGKYKENIETSSKLLNIDKDVFEQTAFKKPQLFYLTPEFLVQNVETTAKLLKQKKEVYIQSALKQPTLFYLKPERINQNVEATSKLLNLKKDDFIKAAVKYPSLFYHKPQTINHNVETTSKLLNLKKEILVKAAVNQPPLFYQKPETINQNIETTGEILNVEKDVLVRAALNRPTLFCQKPETINQNIESTAQLLNIDKDVFIKAAIKRPALFGRSPETLNQNIEVASKLLNLEKEVFVQAAIKQPTLFCQKPDTLNQNVETISKLLNVEKSVFVQAALKQPTLFYRAPESINSNIETTSQLLNTKKDAFVKSALIKPQLFILKPETIVKKVKIMQYYDEILGNKNNRKSVLLYSDEKLYHRILDYLVTSQHKLKSSMSELALVSLLEKHDGAYKFEIPQNSLTQEFIEYAQNFSLKHLHKQIFNFKIKI